MNKQIILKSNENICLRDFVMPKDLNGNGTLFGGEMLAYLDKAGAMISVAKTKGRIVLASMKEVNFKSPVSVGEMVTVYAIIEKVGRTSLTIRMEAWKSNRTEGDTLAAEATAIYVAIGDDHKPRSIQLADNI
jgi:acyl-CoA thioesterase YciA